MKGKQLELSGCDRERFYGYLRVSADKCGYLRVTFFKFFRERTAFENEDATMVYRTDQDLPCPGCDHTPHLFPLPVKGRG